MKVLLITGDAGHVQGWGDLETTRNMCKAIEESGKEAEILYVNNMEELERGLKTLRFDIVWSALYHVSENGEYVGLASSDTSWIGDILNERGIPFIGPGAQTMKDLINKSATTNILRNANIPVPEQHVVNEGEEIYVDKFPMIVKPCFESESTGICEESVVCSQQELIKRLNYIHNTFRQPALVEEYLPGREFTVAVLKNGSNREILPVENIIERNAYENYPLVTVELKVKDLISFSVPKVNYNESIALANDAAEVLCCYDHIRIDMREDVTGKLKIIEVNGIPGLNPIKSRSLQIHSLYYPGFSKKENFKMLINKIVDSAIERHGIGHSLSYSGVNG